MAALEELGEAQQLAHQAPHSRRDCRTSASTRALQQNLPGERKGPAFAAPAPRAGTGIGVLGFRSYFEHAVKRRDAPFADVGDHAFQSSAAVSCPECDEILFLIDGNAVVRERAGGSNLADLSSELFDRARSPRLLQQRLEANRELCLEGTVFASIEPAPSNGRS
jgi:hypothetical protein